MITLVKKKPGEDPKVAKVADTLESYHGILGGYLEIVPIHDLQLYKIDLFCNENWRELNMQPNLYSPELAGDGLIGGTVYAVSHDKFGDTESLQDYQINEADKWMRAHAITYVK